MDEVAVSDIALRRATLADVDAIMAIEAPVFGHEAWSSEAMARDVADANCVYVVAEARDEAGTTVVAYAGLLCPPGSGEADVQTIAVVPNARSKGLGRRLMAELLAAAEQRRATRIFLEVRADNAQAITLYTSLGFDEIAVRPGYYQPEGVDAVVMRRESPHTPTLSPGAIGAEVIAGE
jgi:ribosomal-protein-alanine N-acetyltransferase